MIMNNEKKYIELISKYNNLCERYNLMCKLLSEFDYDKNTKEDAKQFINELLYTVSKKEN